MFDFVAFTMVYFLVVSVAKTVLGVMPILGTVIQLGNGQQGEVVVELWMTRSLVCSLYLALNLITSFKFTYVDKLAFLVKDGVLLPLIASVYLFDRVTMNVVATCFPVVTIIFNIGLLREIHQKSVKTASNKAR